MKVREVIKVIEKGGWSLVRTKGSHRQFKHFSKPGLVTVPGHGGDELAPGTLNSIYNASRTQMSKYLIILEPTATGYSTYSPDLPGCVSAGSSREEAQRNMREAIEFHLEGLREEGIEVPNPRSEPAFCEVG